MGEGIVYEILIQGVLERISCIQAILKSTERVWFLRESVLIHFIGN